MRVMLIAELMQATETVVLYSGCQELIFKAVKQIFSERG